MGDERQQRRAANNPQMRFNFRELLQETPPSTKELMIRRSQLKNLRPLRSLCLRSIVKNMDRLWCKDFADNWSNQEAALLLGPFDELPASLVTDLIETLRTMDCLRFKYFPLLITCKLEVLNLTLLNNINRLLVPIRYKCKELLRELSLEHCKGFSIRAFKDTLACLSNLRVLNLRHTDVGDDVLGTLGSNNKVLRELYLCNTKVTNKGVQHLCIDDGHMGQCKNLLVLTLEDTNVDEDGLLVALENLPNLKLLDSLYLSSAALRWHSEHPEGVLYVQRMMFNLDELNAEHVEELVYMCPRLHEISFCPSESTFNFDPFLNLTHLSKVTTELSCIPPMPLLLHLGKSITHLTLIGNAHPQEVDLTVIGSACPQLISLVTREVLLVESPFTPSRSHFSNIQIVSLEGKKLFSLDKNLICILTSEHLKDAKLTRFCLPDAVLDHICQDAEANRKILAKLTDMEINMCTRVTKKGILNLICCAPALQRLYLLFCDDILRAEADELKDFVESKRLGISVFWL